MAIQQHLILSGASLLKLSSFMFWSWLYLWVAASQPDKTPEWCARVVTLLHGSVASIVGLKQCDVMNITPCRLTKEVTMAQYGLMLWSWGYFAMDFLWCIVYWSENLVMLCHHLSALYAVSIYMNKRNGGCTFACNLSLMEITNPLLQTRWFIRYAGFGKTNLFYIAEVAYLVMFVVVRGVIGSYVLYRLLSSDIFGLEEKIVSIIFCGLTWTFMYDIYGYIRHKYDGRIQAVLTMEATSTTGGPPSDGGVPPASAALSVPVRRCCHLHVGKIKISRGVQTLPKTLAPKATVLRDKSYEPLKIDTAKFNLLERRSFSALTAGPQA